MIEPYLIAHVVRGEPAFDIAIKLQIGAEDGWIIPTSGHRAYPYWYIPLRTILLPDTYYECELCTWKYLPNSGNYMWPDPPPSWPDHYTTSAAPKSAPSTDILGLLNLRAAAQPLTRRSFK